MKILAVIPARAGSRGIKNKNITKLNKKSLIEYTFLAATKSNLKDIFLITDCIKTKKISKKYKINHEYNRPKNLSGDYARIVDVVSFETKKLEKKIDFKNVCCIFPTAIFLDSASLWEGFKKLSRATNYVFSAIADEKSVLKNFFFYKSKLFFVQPNFKNYFTQNLPITYKDAGQFYWGSKKNWLNKKNIFSNKSKIILLKSKKIIDLDTISDWKKVLKIKK